MADTSRSGTFPGALCFLGLLFIAQTGCSINATIEKLQADSSGNPSAAKDPVTLSYSAIPSELMKGTGVSLLTPATAGSPTSFTVSPSFPAGLNLDPNTGVISGTPTVGAIPQMYTVTASNGSYSATASLSFEVAVTYVVDTTNDTSDNNLGDFVCKDSSNNCSLRGALEEAAQNSGILAYVSVPAGTYGLLSQALTVGSRLTLTGAGASSTIIDANPDASPLSQVMTIADYAVILDGFAIKNAAGTTPVGGKAINSGSSALTLKNCTIQNNSGIGYGGGVYLNIPSGGTVTIKSCLFDNNQTLNNTVYGGGNGGGLYAIAPSSTSVANLTIEDSTFSNNVAAADMSHLITAAGGGAFVTGYMNLIVKNSVFNLNSTSTDVGGGMLVSVYQPGSTLIQNSTFTNNSCAISGVSGGGAISFYNHNAGIIIKDSTFKDNTSDISARGGMIAANSPSSMVFQGSTFSGTTNGGRAIYLSNVTTASFINCTFNTNVTPIGLKSVPTTTLTHNTMSNSFGLINALSGVGTVTFFANILSAGSSLCTGGYTGISNGYNVVGDNSCASFMTGPGDLNNTSAGLNAIASNGGPTQTMAIGSVSAAKDIVPVGSCTQTTDQRGNSRPNGSACDAGAFEY